MSAWSCTRRERRAFAVRRGEPGNDAPAFPGGVPGGVRAAGRTGPPDVPSGELGCEGRSCRHCCSRCHREGRGGTFPPPRRTFHGTFRGPSLAVLETSRASGTLGLPCPPPPPNERLRTAMLRTGTTIEDLALCCGVDVKTIERWLALGRVPHRGSRWDAARRLGAEETWPVAAGGVPAARGAAQSELVRLYPDRASVPRETWLALMDGARDDIAVLVMSGTFFAQTPAEGRPAAHRSGGSRRTGTDVLRRPGRRGGRHPRPGGRPRAAPSRRRSARR